MTKNELADCIQRQLAQHGYDIARGAAEDTAAQILQARQEHAIYQCLSARLALVEAGIEDGNVPWFRSDHTPEAELIVRDWIADHADRVAAESRAIGLVVTHRATFSQIVTLYPSMDHSVWSPAQAVQQ